MSSILSDHRSHHKYDLGAKRDCKPFQGGMCDFWLTVGPAAPQTEFVAGYIFPGKPIANIVFKVLHDNHSAERMALTASAGVRLHDFGPVHRPHGRHEARAVRTTAFSRNT